MSNPSKKAKIASTSGGPFAKRPREMLVWILEFFTMYEVAGLQRLVCVEFREAGQERIHERGGRKLYEDGMAYFYGLDHKTIDKPRGCLLLRASRDAGCMTALAMDLMATPNLSDEGKQKVLKDLKEIATASPYHWVYFFIGAWYARGWGGEEKKNQAVAWFEKAAHKGNTHAMYDLGLTYDNGHLGLTQSDTKANELWAVAAEKGNANSMVNLATCYAKGELGLTQSDTKANELYALAADKGHVPLISGTNALLLLNQFLHRYHDNT